MKALNGGYCKRTKAQSPKTAKYLKSIFLVPYEIIIYKGILKRRSFNKKERLFSFKML